MGLSYIKKLIYGYSIETPSVYTTYFLFTNFHITHHMKHKRSIKRNLGAALKGLGIALQEEISFKILTIAAVLSIVIMYLLPLSRTEKAVVWIMVFSVLVLEMINAVVERILDFIYPEYNEKIGAIKDLMAGIVLLVSLASFIIAWLIFAPKIPLFQSLWTM